MPKRIPAVTTVKQRESIEAEIYNYYNVSLDIIQFLLTCRIRSGVGFVAFDCYPYQAKLLEIIEAHPGTIIIKDRQLGITELLAGLALWHMFLRNAFSGAMISINQQKTSEVRDRIKTMPASAKWERNSGLMVKLEKGGQFALLPATDNAARGLPSVAHLYFDEAGFPKNFPELYGAGTAAQSMVSDEHRKTVICTTIPPDGTANPVWQMFAADNGSHNVLKEIKRARAAEGEIPGMVWWVDENGWAKVIVGHKAHPIYSKKPDYIRYVMDKYKIPFTMANREYNLGIESATSSLFSEAAIEAYKVGSWQGHRLGHTYYGMIDPNFGGSDNFVLEILDITNPQAVLVAEYAEANVSTENSVKEALRLLQAYACKHCAIESNSGGKIIYEQLQSKSPDIEWLLCLTTNQSKRTNTDRLAYGLEIGELIYPPDWLGMDELRSFSALEREATNGQKDDRVMALAAGWAYMEYVRATVIPAISPGGVRR